MSLVRTMLPKGTIISNYLICRLQTTPLDIAYHDFNLFLFPVHLLTIHLLILCCREFDGNKTLEHEIPRRLLAEDKLFISYLLLYVLRELVSSICSKLFSSA